MTEENPEIGQSVDVNGINTNYHRMGSGEPLFMVHGSGPGVTAWANWRLVMPHLAEKFDVVAPESSAGTRSPEGFSKMAHGETICSIRQHWHGKFSSSALLRAGLPSHGGEHPTGSTSWFCGCRGVPFPDTEVLERFGVRPSQETCGRS